MGEKSTDVILFKKKKKKEKKVHFGLCQDTSWKKIV